MYRIPSREDSIGDGASATSVIVPIEPLRWRERCRIRRAGIVDRIRYRVVADDHRTHYLHIVERQVRLMDAEVVKRLDATLSRIDTRIAELDAIVAEPAPTATVTQLAPAEPAGTVEQLESLTGRDRHEWAAARRARRAAAAAQRSAAAAAARKTSEYEDRTEAARIERAKLAAQRSALIAEGDAVRRLWREAFVLRGALYTRSRFGIFGPRPTDTPAVPEYAFADGPRGQRDR